MKKIFPTSLLVLSGIAAVTYFVLPAQPDEKHAIQTSKSEFAKSEEISFPKATHSRPESVISKVVSYGEQTKSVWQPIAQQQQPETLPDNLQVEYIQVADKNSMTFSEGEKVSFLIPQENKSFVGIINESTRAFGDVNISSGDIENGKDHASFSITEGENTTFVTVATGENIYQIEIDNQSGIGVVLDDRELNQYRLKEDGIFPPPEGVS